jgi:hypothetical protein|tara:strand:- start:106 stop:420 length:315 start_codon:yes stop_codon:yes gene_type:complete
LKKQLYIDLQNSIAGDLLFERNIDYRLFITNELFNKHIATNDLEELDNRLYQLAYSAIIGMEGGTTNWGTFSYSMNKRTLILINILQESKKYGQVLTICLPEEV